jgi:membrane protease YdiL (CAAX protease family)
VEVLGQEWELGPAQALLGVFSFGLGALALLLGRRFFVYALPAAPSRSEVVWGLRELALVALAYLPLGQLCFLLLAPLGGLVPKFVLALFTAVLASLGAIALAVALASRAEGRTLRRLDSLRSFGLFRGGAFEAILAGGLAYAIGFPLLFGLMLLWPFVLEQVGIGFEPQAVMLEFMDLEDRWLWIALPCAVFIVPFCEEFLFRGFMQPALIKRLGAWNGVALTSVVFAALHGTSAFLPIFALSMLLGAVQLHTGRLLSAWTLHAVHNGLNVLVLLVARTLSQTPA